MGAAPKLGLPLFRPLPAAPFTLAARPAGHTKRTGRAAQPLLQFSEDGDDEEYAGRSSWDVKGALGKPIPIAEAWIRLFQKASSNA